MKAWLLAWSKFALNLAKLWLQTYAVLAKSSVELSRHSEVGVVEDAFGKTHGVRLGVDVVGVGVGVVRNELVLRQKKRRSTDK